LISSKPRKANLRVNEPSILSSENPSSALSSAHNSERKAEGPSDDTGLDYLLDLDGWVSEVGGGFWIKVCVARTEAGGPAPHGLIYSLTLHRPGGERVIGYDNAHPSAKRQGMRRAPMPTSDHRHYRDRVEPYVFLSPIKLVEDFWADVERFLQQEGVTNDG
jgi:hypothetical protein